MQPAQDERAFFCMAILKTTTMAEELHRNSTAPEDDALAAGAQITGFMRTISVMDKSTFAELAAHPADVIRAAYEGRIAQLFVARGPLVWPIW